MHRQFWQPCTQLLHQSGSESSKHKERKRKKKEKRLHTWVTTAAQTIQYMGDGATWKAQLRLDTNGGSNAELP
jgi:hypothetical protein